MTSVIFAISTIEKFRWDEKYEKQIARLPTVDLYTTIITCKTNSLSKRHLPLVDLVGFEPMTSALRTQRSPS